jgi:hypothetical protein
MGANYRRIVREAIEGDRPQPNQTALIVFRRGMLAAIPRACDPREPKTHQKVWTEAAYRHARATGRAALQLLAHYDRMEQP